LAAVPEVDGERVAKIADSSLVEDEWDGWGFCLDVREFRGRVGKRERRLTHRVSPR
jgi:hypothetical protein